MKTCPVCDTDYPDQHTNCDTDGAVLIVSQELAPGSLVRGKYRIVRKIGQGGMGVVYLAEDTLLGVKVALKFLAGDLGKDPRFIKRFRTEARAAYQLRHPNIAEVTNLDQAEDGSLFIAMEYVEGPSLRSLLDQHPNGLDIPRALEITRGIASGLAAAHAQGTIHRDIKPENILITRAPDGTERAKVLDFGIAAVAESVTRMTRTQGFILTYAYAAPEQWQEMPADQMDGRTDLYALGCVLYEMLTGTTPFHAHTTAGWMKAHCEESPKPPSTLRPEIAEWSNLNALLAILLAKDRNRRPENSAELMNLIGTVKRLPQKEAKPPIERKMSEVIGPKQTVVETNTFESKTFRWHKLRWIVQPLKRRWKLCTAVFVPSALLLLVVVPRMLLPEILVTACKGGDPRLASLIGDFYSLLGPFGANAYSYDNQQCASGHSGWSCLDVAGSHYINGGQVLNQQDEQTLTARGLDLMTRHCYQGEDGKYFECDELGKSYIHEYGGSEGLFLRSGINLSVPDDSHKAIDAFVRGCDMDSTHACVGAGDLFYRGSGTVTKDIAKARLNYTLATQTQDCQMASQNNFACYQAKAQIAAIDASNASQNSNRTSLPLYFKP